MDLEMIKFKEHTVVTMVKMESWGRNRFHQWKRKRALALRRTGGHLRFIIISNCSFRKHRHRHRHTRARVCMPTRTHVRTNTHTPGELWDEGLGLISHIINRTTDMLADYCTSAWLMQFWVSLWSIDINCYKCYRMLQWLVRLTTTLCISILELCSDSNHQVRFVCLLVA